MGATPQGIVRRSGSSVNRGFERVRTDKLSKSIRFVSADGLGTASDSRVCFESHSAASLSTVCLVSLRAHDGLAGRYGSDVSITDPEREPLVRFPNSVIVSDMAVGLASQDRC